MLHIPNSAEGNCLTDKENHTLSEKRHEINKFTSCQNIIARDSLSFDRHVFVSSQDRYL